MLLNKFQNFASRLILWSIIYYVSHKCYEKWKIHYKNERNAYFLSIDL